MSKSAKDELIAKIKEEAPEAPGVYLFRDFSGTIIYIGKSINLKKRILSYFQKGAALEERTKRMAFCVNSFSFVRAMSELHALLIEDLLIKEQIPHYNIRQNEFEDYCYLALSNDQFPALRMVYHDNAADEQRIFGPFPNIYFAGDIKVILSKYLLIRPCSDIEPIKRCVNFEIKTCSGPCFDKITTKEYSKIVRRVSDFLHGDDSFIIERMQERMAHSADNLDYEAAAKIKKQIVFAEKFCSRQRFIGLFKKEDLLLEEIGEDEVVHEFEKGVLVPNICVSSPKGAKDADICLSSSGALKDKRFMADRANIVYSWMVSHRDKFRCRFSVSGVYHINESAV